jgi:lipoprotein Spr
MKRILILCSACVLLFSGCGAKNVYTNEVLPVQTSNDTHELLSKQFNLKLSQKDNIELYDISSKWLKTPYKMGGNSKKGVDCSGFVNAVYKDVYKKTLNRSTANIFKKDIAKVELSNLNEGDLVFFRTGKGDKKVPNHVGIYLKDGKFIHASTSKGVIVSSLDEQYYKKAWISGGKVK